MADLFSTLSANYKTAGTMVPSASKYTDVDADAFTGNWSGKYASGQSFRIQVSNVQGFRARALYESGGVVKSQDVLIRDNSFRVGDSRFILRSDGGATVKSVVSGAGGQTLETANAKR